MPRIGLLSDSHGHHRTTRQAVKLLLQAGAQELICLGDAGSCEVLDELLVARPRRAGDGPQAGSAPLPVHLVFGNVDWDAPSLARYARELGFDVQHPAGQLPIESGRILAYTHGNDHHLMNAALRARVAYLCHGHTHQKADTRHGPTRIINPGALSRAAIYTVALLDTARDDLQFLEVPGHA